MRLPPALLWPVVVAAAAALAGVLAAGCRRQPAAETVARRTEAAAQSRQPADRPVLSAELAAALPRLTAAEPRGCDPPPAGLPPQLRVDAACRVQVAVIVEGDAAALEARIAGAGGAVTRRGGGRGGEPLTLQVWAPPALLEALATDPDVAAVRIPTYARPVAR